jgi:hypothetical protein
MLVYFLNNSHTTTDKEYFRHLVERMENNSFEVFWPEREGADTQDKAGLAKRRQAMAEASIVVLAIGSRPLMPEEALDLGMAIGLRDQQDPPKLLAGVAMAAGNRINDHLSVVSLDCVAKSEYDLIDCLKSYLVTVSRWQGRTAGTVTSNN